MFTTSIKNAIGQVSGVFRSGYPALSDRDAIGTSETSVVSLPSSSSAPAMHISVLLVDDEPLLLDVGKLSLEHVKGISVTTAGSAAEALELSASGTFDVIVSDYQMPEMDGIALLRKIRTRSPVQPFIIFTGRGREDVVIEALNNGADYYVQKGGDPKAQFAELLHKIRRAVRQRRSEVALIKKHEILRALLMSSPNGIAFVRNRTLQWVNESMAMMLGYSRAELKEMHLSQLYENEDTYNRIGSQIQTDLKSAGKSKVITRFRHKAGFSIDTEIHIAPLDRGNLHYGHMITMMDITEKVAIAGNNKKPAPFPHLELSPVIELNRKGEIIYYNDAAIDAMSRFGSRGTLEEFFPQDIQEILVSLDEKNVGSVYRNIVIGPAVFRVHITLSAQFQVLRLSALNISGQPVAPQQ
ncbi:MAG: response regulator [Methanoregula sp.]